MTASVNASVSSDSGQAWGLSGRTSPLHRVQDRLPHAGCSHWNSGRVREERRLDAARGRRGSSANLRCSLSSTPRAREVALAPHGRRAPARRPCAGAAPCSRRRPRGTPGFASPSPIRAWTRCRTQPSQTVCAARAAHVRSASRAQYHNSTGTRPQAAAAAAAASAPGAAASRARARQRRLGGPLAVVVEESASLRGASGVRAAWEWTALRQHFGRRSDGHFAPACQAQCQRETSAFSGRVRQLRAADATSPVVTCGANSAAVDGQAHERACINAAGATKLL